MIYSIEIDVAGKYVQLFSTFKKWKNDNVVYYRKTRIGEC